MSCVLVLFLWSNSMEERWPWFRWWWEPLNIASSIRSQYHTIGSWQIGVGPVSPAHQWDLLQFHHLLQTSNSCLSDRESNLQVELLKTYRPITINLYKASRYQRLVFLFSKVGPFEGMLSSWGRSDTGIRWSNGGHPLDARPESRMSGERTGGPQDQPSEF